jgi:hypothetical protein
VRRPAILWWGIRKSRSEIIHTPSLRVHRIENYQTSGPQFPEPIQPMYVHYIGSGTVRSLLLYGARFLSRRISRP